MQVAALWVEPQLLSLPEYGRQGAHVQVIVPRLAVSQKSYTSTHQLHSSFSLLPPRIPLKQVLL